MGCPNTVYTDASFYEFQVMTNQTLKSIDFDVIKSMNCTIIMKDGEKDVAVELDNLKLFLKLHVFMLLFHFFTEGLPKYDIDASDLPNQYDNDIDNSPKIIFKAYLNDSIVCLDDLKDTIATKLDLCFIFDRFNIKSLKEQLLSQPFSIENDQANMHTTNEIRFNIIKCNPFFTKYEDLDGTKSFKKINKRELIKPFALCYSSKTKIERTGIETFSMKSSTDITVEKVSVKISINQIASFISMINNTSRILNEKYIERIKNDEEMNMGRGVINNSLQKRNNLQDYHPEEDTNKFKETFDIFSSRYSTMPMTRLNSSTYQCEEEEEEIDALVSKRENLTKLTNSIKKIKNPNDEEEKKEIPEEGHKIESNKISFFFEGLSVFFINDYKDNFYPVLCLSLKETNYNKEQRIDGSFVSGAQLQASGDYYNIKNGYWEPFIEGVDIEFQYDKQLENCVIQIKGKESINLNLSPDFAGVLNSCLKSWEEAQHLSPLLPVRTSIKDGRSSMSEESKQLFEDAICAEERNTVYTLTGDEETVDIATPYRVRNMTGVNVFIETLFGTKSEKYILKDCQTSKIAISYEKQTTKNFDGYSSKMNDNIKIQFQGLYLPIHKIALNKISQGIHKLTENEEVNDFIYYETKVIDMNKVLTLRTKNLFINSTQFSYVVLIKNPFNASEDKKYTIKPGESIPFPKEFYNCKISLKTTDDKEFSNYISAKKLIFKTEVDHTNYIKSGDTFTMVRKKANSTMKDCYDVHLIPPIRIKNGLPVSMSLSMVGKDMEFILDKSEEKHISYYSPEPDIELLVSLDGFKSASLPVKFLKKSYEKYVTLRAEDNKHSYLNIYASFSDHKAGCNVTFYAKTCFINASSANISIYNTTSDSRGIYVPSVKSWKNLTLAPDIHFCYFTLDKDSTSEEINIEGGSLTGQVSLMKKSTKETAELVYTANLSLVDLNQSIYTKVITILPKYVIINKTSHKLMMTQEKLDDDFIIIDSNARENFRWLDGKGVRKVMLKILDQQASDPINEWKWSSPFILEEIGAHSVRNLNTNDQDKFLYWKIDRRIQNDIIFITINEEDPQHPLYRIENKAKDIILKYKQTAGTNWEYCDTNNSNSFAWDSLYEPHTVSVEAWITSKSKKKLCKVSVDFDKMENNEEYKYDLKQIMTEEEIREGGFEDRRRVIHYRTYTNGYTKILSFDDKIQEPEEKEIEDHTPELMVNIELGGIGVSVICDCSKSNVNERREIIFCSFTDIQGICIDFKTERRLQLRIGKLQIDNQFVHDTPYPVTLFSNNIKIENNEERVKPFFNLSLVISKDIPDVTYFKKIEFLIQKLVLKCDDELVMNFVSFTSDIMEILKTTFTGINEIFIDDEQMNSKLGVAYIAGSQEGLSKRLITKVPDWRNEEISASKYQIYIKYYSSSPLQMTISYYSTMKSESDEGFHSFLKRFGLALNTIEGAPIKINALELKEVVGTANDIAYILQDRYMIRLKRNVLSLLGASSLIGNPIQLVNNVSTGVKDFFYKPIEGFVEGPIEGGKGLMKGTGSLLKHTVKGTFGSTSSIFSSLSKGVLVLANDKEYIKEREVMNQKDRPDNFIEGVGFGIKSAAKSFGSGVTGLVRMPLNGAKNKGFAGFLKGTVKGVTGLVAKPVSGAMDFVYKTSEGIKNTAELFEDGKSLGTDRMRLPRVFYLRERIYREFNELHSYCYAYLYKHKKITVVDPFVDALVVCKEPIQILVL